ncbi:hypothetical protein DINM_000680 [Dirofilaria immitis]|nr:hypothetical protein [Dirofilaria immitis]
MSNCSDTSKSVPERVTVIQLRKTSVRFSPTNKIIRHPSENTSALPMIGTSQYGSNMKIDPDSTLNYVHLMQFNACYEAMPTNTRHVLLSDSAKNNEIVGILSVTDFIRVLYYCTS